MLYIKMAGVYKLISRDAYNKSGDNKIYQRNDNSSYLF